LNGKFWIYGGEGYDANNNYGYLADLWVYDPSAGTWTWVSGSDTDVGEYLIPAVYGALGVSAPGNTPGSRWWASSWADKNGNFWLFGGLDEPSDLWEFNTTTNEWAWMAGSNTLTEGVACAGSAINPCAERGIYGALGIPDPGNTPGARQNAFSWTDPQGGLWLYGGEGEDSQGYPGVLNDLWRFNPSSNEWAWMNGSSTLTCEMTMYGGQCLVQPVFGALGAPEPTNTPGGRQSGANWVDSSGNLWLFGGAVTDASGGDLSLNDVWEYSPSVSTLPPAITPTLSLPSGDYQSSQTLTISNGMANASFFYTTDGTTPTSNSTLYSGPLTISSTETVQAIATAPGYPESGLASATYEFISDIPTFSEPGGTYNSVISVAISETTPNAAIYYTTDGSLPSSGSNHFTSPITISSSETVKAIAVLNGYSSNVASVSYIINTPSMSLTAQPNSLTVSSGSSGTVTLTVTPSNGFNSAVTFACSGLPSGATCSFSPASVTPSGATATTQLTIAAAQSSALRTGSGSWFPATALAVAIYLFGFRRRRLTQLFLFAIAAIALSTVSACGGGGGGPTPTPTPIPTISVVTVTATSGSIQQSATISLTLN
jgi:hypothetical protein